MKDKSIPKSMLNELYDLCISIHACAELNQPVKCNGESINPYEALAIIERIEEIIGTVSKDDIEKRMEKIKIDMELPFG